MQDVIAGAENVELLNAWAEVGQAVLIWHHDTAEVEALMPAIAASAGMRIEVAEVDGSDDPLGHLGLGEPVMIFLKPGEWLGGQLAEEGNLFGRARDPRFSAATAYAFRRVLADLLMGPWRGRNIVIVTSIERVNQVDPFLRAAGLFDRKVGLPALNSEARARVFMAEAGTHRFDEQVQRYPDRLGGILANQLDCHRRRGLFRQALVRKHRAERRPIREEDIMEYAAYGTTAADEALPPTPESLWGTAVHEAGHALVAHLDSRDRVIPAYCSVLPRGSTAGMM
ncbi:MAG: hypothetical protein FGM40_04265, partial [Rhodocyclaceae bacterium]|nr:hypothetical protein [Rhodocyclaceae bacterium]